VRWRISGLVLVGFAGIDPWKGELAIRELERSLKVLGLKGAKFHPGRQEFYPNDRRFYPLFETASSLGAPVLFHTGMMAAGAGTPGGRGQRRMVAREVAHTDPAYLLTVRTKRLIEQKTVVYTARRL